MIRYVLKTTIFHDWAKSLSNHIRRELQKPTKLLGLGLGLSLALCFMLLTVNPRSSSTRDLKPLTKKKMEEKKKTLWIRYASLLQP